MNPILPQQYFIPDVEAHQWEDGRMYLYGSFDINGDTFYCSRKYHTFSSDDLINWIDHGVSFDLDKSHSPESSRLFAPDCFHKNDKYYLVYCGNDGSEGIAQSNNPGGPFGNGKAIKGADGLGIDPAVFHDDDGKVYYFWGQFNLIGAQLNDDLTSLNKNIMQYNILTEESHGFHEGASIRKRKGIYYLLYTDISSGKATSLAYATSDKPLGPYRKRGIIIDNRGCDSESWNNHGSLAEFNGKWFVFYHRSSQGSKYNRRVCAEPIRFNDDGSINEVEMTSQGISSPINAEEKIDAYRACQLSGKIKSESIQSLETDNDFSENLTSIHNGDWAVYKYLNFTGDLRKFSVTAGSLTGGGTIEVYCDDSNGPLLCSCIIPDTGGWKKWKQIDTELLLPIEGVHGIYILFKGNEGRLFDLLDFTFKK